MDIIFSASIIASFLAGMVALFAPCCITVLLPAYFASAFREKKNILKMTLVFFAGISVILIPIGLGAAWLAEIFRDFHSQLYVFGGSLMVLLGLLAIMGRTVSMPLPRRLKSGANLTGAKSVFVLGILSGAATSCCAPVLAGAMTLAVASGTFVKALIVVFAYVFGMTFPLFVTAYFYDRYKIDQSKLIKGKMLELGKTRVHSTNLISAVIFLIMGIVMLVLGLSGNAFWSPGHQVELGQALNGWSRGFLEFLGFVPDFGWGIIIISLFIFFLLKAKKNKKHETTQ